MPFRLLFAVLFLILLSLAHLQIVPLSPIEFKDIVKLNILQLAIHFLVSLILLISVHDTHHHSIKKHIWNLKGYGYRTSLFLSYLITYLFYLKANDLDTEFLVILSALLIAVTSCFILLIEHVINKV